VSADIIDLNSRRPAAATRSEPAEVVLVTAICASLVWDKPCGQPLAYQRGAWRHPRTRHGCTEPQPAMCQHDCGETADIDQRCGKWFTFCCGCCWEHEDQLEGRQLWPTTF
jgi:hypothetical protein